MFQSLPWWAKAAFLFIFIVSGVSILDFLSKKPELLSSLSSQNISAPIRVSRTILNRQNSQPVKDVGVQLIFDGPPVQAMTDRNGYFEVQVPSGKKRVQITLTKEGFETVREEINLEADPNANKPIYLDPTKPSK